MIFWYISYAQAHVGYLDGALAVFWDAIFHRGDSMMHFISTAMLSRCVVMRHVNNCVFIPAYNLRESNFAIVGQQLLRAIVGLCNGSLVHAGTDNMDDHTGEVTDKRSPKR